VLRRRCTARLPTRSAHPLCPPALPTPLCPPALPTRSARPLCRRAGLRSAQSVSDSIDPQLRVQAPGVLVASTFVTFQVETQDSISPPHPPADRFELLHRVGIALSAETNRDRLLETILREAQDLCNADGGTLYLRTDDDQLRFEILRNKSLGVELGGVTGAPVPYPALPLYDAAGKPNLNNIASYAVHEKSLVHVRDAYHAEGFDFSGTKDFDRRSGYRSTSFLTIPLINGRQQVIGVLQLLNAMDPATSEVVPFAPEHRETVVALASQAALALDNKLLLEAQKVLLESFIKLIAAAIDSKSPYTGGHCERVPVLTEMIVEALCQTTDGPFATFGLDDEEWYELRIAAWLHDCGKVTTPVHIMDKATKLETICDRIEAVSHRFEILRQQALIRRLERQNRGDDPGVIDSEYTLELEQLRLDEAFLRHVNIGGEFLPKDAQDRIIAIGKRTFLQAGEERRLLSDEELENLCVARGTLTDDERMVINGHMVDTIRMLEALPFPKNLRRVPEYAAGHHEKMDGGGYPRGTFAGDMSVPARAMAVADVFEALTAGDRPYKKAKKLSEAMKIMGFMKKDNHLDPLVFDEFVKSGVYLEYARRYLADDLIDAVDTEALLAIVPRPYELPPQAERQLRRSGLLPAYEARFPLRDSIIPTQGR
jgi:HD-GYP domain-containing protein (c-di-GMP phosphodiesterase class II)